MRDAVDRGEPHWEKCKRRAEDEKDSAERPQATPFSLAGTQRGGNSWYTGEPREPMFLGGGGGVQMPETSAGGPGRTGADTLLRKMEEQAQELETILRKTKEQETKLETILRKLDEQAQDQEQGRQRDLFGQHRDHAELGGVITQLQQGMENMHDLLLCQRTEYQGDVTKLQQRIESLHEAQSRQQVELHASLTRKIEARTEHTDMAIDHIGASLRQAASSEGPIWDMIEGKFERFMQTLDSYLGSQQQGVRSSFTGDSDDHLQDISRRQVTLIERIGELQIHGDEQFMELREDMKKGINKSLLAMSGGAIDSIETTFREFSVRQLSRMQQQIVDAVRGEIKNLAAAAAPGGGAAFSRRSTPVVSGADTPRRNVYDASGGSPPESRTTSLTGIAGGPSESRRTTEAGSASGPPESRAALAFSSRRRREPFS